MVIKIDCWFFFYTHSRLFSGRIQAGFDPLSQKGAQPGGEVEETVIKEWGFPKHSHKDLEVRLLQSCRVIFLSHNNSYMVINLS